MNPSSIKDTVGSDHSSNSNNNNNNSDAIISHSVSASNSNYDSNDEDDEVLAPIPMKVLPFKAPPKKTTFYLEATDDLDASFSQPNPLKPILLPPPPPPPTPSKLLQTNATKDIGGTVMSGNLLLKPNRPKSIKRADIDALPRIISTDDDNDDAIILDRTGTPLLSPTQSLLSKSSAIHSSLMQPPPPQSIVSLSSSSLLS